MVGQHRAGPRRPGLRLGGVPISRRQYAPRPRGDSHRGFALNRIRVARLSLGSAAILFVAIGLSTANPGIQLPPLLYQFGLALFVYCIGLAAGPAFFRTLRSRGLALNVIAAGLLVGLTALAFVLVRWSGADAIAGAGMFAGAMSSTPGMAAILAAVPDLLPAGADPDAASAAVVGYSLASGRRHPASSWWPPSARVCCAWITSPMPAPPGACGGCITSASASARGAN